MPKHSKSNQEQDQECENENSDEEWDQSEDHNQNNSNEGPKPNKIIKYKKSSKPTPAFTVSKHKDQNKYLVYYGIQKDSEKYIILNKQENFYICIDTANNNLHVLERSDYKKLNKDLQCQCFNNTNIAIVMSDKALKSDFQYNDTLNPYGDSHHLSITAGLGRSPPITTSSIRRFSFANTWKSKAKPKHKNVPILKKLFSNHFFTIPKNVKFACLFRTMVNKDYATIGIAESDKNVYEIYVFINNLYQFDTIKNFYKNNMIEHKTSCILNKNRKSENRLNATDGDCDYDCDDDDDDDDDDGDHSSKSKHNMQGSDTLNQGIISDTVNSTNAHHTRISNVPETLVSETENDVAQNHDEEEEEEEEEESIQDTRKKKNNVNYKFTNKQKESHSVITIREKIIAGVSFIFLSKSILFGIISTTISIKIIKGLEQSDAEITAKVKILTFINIVKNYKPSMTFALISIVSFAIAVILGIAFIALIIKNKKNQNNIQSKENEKKTDKNKEETDENNIHKSNNKPNEDSMNADNHESNENNTPKNKHVTPEDQLKRHENTNTLSEQEGINNKNGTKVSEAKTTSNNTLKVNFK